MKFLKVILKKVFSYILFLIAILSFIYVSARLIPGDPVTILCGELAGDPSTRSIIESKLGFDKPIHVQLLIYIKNIFTGYWGKSIYTGESVTSIILGGLISSLKLAFISIILSFALCIPLLYAEFVHNLNNKILQLVTSLFGSLPTAVWCTITLLLLVWLRHPIVFGSILPPLTVLTITGTGILYKILKPVIEYGYQQPFISTFIAMGYSREQIFAKILRYSLPIAFSTILYRAGLIIAGAIVVESIFRYPGMGFIFYLALISRDYPILIGWGIAVSIILISINFAVDVIHCLLDPRVSNYEV